MRTTLVAVGGMSPAILTETLWALAGESPPTIPDDVVVITTSRGEDDLSAELLSPRSDWGGRSVWETLRDDLLRRAGLPGPSARLQLSVRVIDLPDPASGVRRKAPDLRTSGDNEDAADFIVRTLAPLCDEEDNRVVASIAGGRKTMGALLYAAMSLLGKEGDRVTHVLVGEGYDECRGFFYPDQPAQELRPRSAGPGDAPLIASAARVELADLPFVVLRNRFEELNEPRRSFAGLVERCARAERDSLRRRPPRLDLDPETGILTVEGRPIRLAGRDLLVAALLHQRAGRGEPHFRDRVEAVEPLRVFVREWRRTRPAHRAAARLSGDPGEDDLSKALASLRKKLRASGLGGAIPHLAPERGRIGFDVAR